MTRRLQTLTLVAEVLEDLLQWCGSFGEKFFFLLQRLYTPNNDHTLNISLLYMEHKLKLNQRKNLGHGTKGTMGTLQLSLVACTSQYLLISSTLVSSEWFNTFCWNVNCSNLLWSRRNTFILRCWSHAEKRSMWDRCKWIPFTWKCPSL